MANMTKLIVFCGFFLAFYAVFFEVGALNECYILNPIETVSTKTAALVSHVA